MKIPVINNFSRDISMEVRFVADETGRTYAGTLNYLIPANSSSLIRPDEFIRLTIQERKYIEIHIKIDRVTHKIVEHDEFEGKKAVILETGNGGELIVNFIPRDDADGGPAFWIRFTDLLPFLRRSAGSASLLDSQV